MINGRQKINFKQAEQIRDLKGSMRQVDIANKFNISQPQVSAIQNHRYLKDIEEW